MSKLLNVARNALRPGYARIMASKAFLRLTETKADPEKVETWCRARTRNLAEWGSRLDPSLWQEAVEFGEGVKQDQAIRTDIVGLGLGSGGAYSLLYFCSRLLKPSVVVETGVAAGFSSRAFLSAFRANGSGRLYSSDFPLFRLDNPADHVGYAVDSDLRGDWTLDLRGDRVALPQFAQMIEHVDLFHYDSDKSASGRDFAYRAIKPRLANDALIIFDDIQDNWHFRDFSARMDSLVFEFQGKWVGIVGGPARLYQGLGSEG